MIEHFKALLEQYETATHLHLALADVSFKFPASCVYPNLCQKLDDFGLINPLEGRTVATLPEIHLALYLGAVLEYHDAVVIETDEENYVFRGHLHELYKLRNTAKKNDQELLQQLYKTYSNSLYGKLAQGIRERRIYNTRDGVSKRLPKSPITNPYYASMTTGLIRAALSSILVALDELNQIDPVYKIISVTTDGALFGIDESRLSIEATLNMEALLKEFDSVTDAFKAGFKKFKKFEEIDPVLSAKLLKFPALRLLKLSHEAWDDPEYIEVKHVANSVTNVKTRGQIGHYKDDVNEVCTLLAKAGHKLPGDKDAQAQWMLDHYNDPEINLYEFTSLSNVQMIVNEFNPVNDLVSLPETRKISLDYDYKRRPINAHDTMPHKDVNDFLKYRQSMSYLRRLNQRATVDDVEYKHSLARQNVRKRGSNQEFCVRHVLRALMHGVKPFSVPTLSYTNLANLLREFKVSVSKIKHAKQSTFTPCMVSDTTGNRACIRKILKTLGYRTRTNYKKHLELLLHKKISNPEDISYLD